MFLKRVRLGAYFHSPLPFRPFATQLSHTPEVKPIDVTVRKDLLSLRFDLTGERPINFFVSPAFTFKTLKETILAQYPSADFDYDFSASQNKKLDEDTNVYEFLESKEK